MPHSRWNELPVDALRQAGYTLLSWSDATGADTFVKERGSLLLFFQGHPEYEGTTLLKEYRRDVGRYLTPNRRTTRRCRVGYLSAGGDSSARGFRGRALAERSPALLSVSRSRPSPLRSEHLGRRGRGALPQLAVARHCRAQRSARARTGIIGLNP